MKQLTTCILSLCTLGCCIQASAMTKLLVATAAVYATKTIANYVFADTSEDLFKACRDGRLDDVQRMIKNNINVNWANNDGITPLMAACGIAHSPIIRALLAARAEVNSIDRMGDTALIYAIRSKSLHAVKTLCEEGHPDLFIESGDHRMPSEFAQEYNQAIARYLEDRVFEYFCKTHKSQHHMDDDSSMPKRRQHHRRSSTPY